MKHLMLPMLLAGCSTGLDEPAFVPSPAELRPHALGTVGALLDAEQIVVGEVTAIQYALSEPGEHGTIPHTFVTWSIEQALKGSAPEELTLRFVGGPLGDGRFMTASSVPLFNLGERDLLLVRGNEDGICPLVGCSQGVLRLLDGRAYSEGGAEIIADASGLREGRIVDAEALHAFDVDGVELRRHTSSAVSQGEGTAEDEVLGWLAGQVQDACPPEHLAALPVAKSADPLKPFSID